MRLRQSGLRFELLTSLHSSNLPGVPTQNFTVRAILKSIEKNAQMKRRIATVPGLSYLFFTHRVYVLTLIID